MLLSVLICTLPKRKTMFDSLMEKIHEYSKDHFNENEIEILSNDNVNISIGEKRNNLLDRAKGKYLVFIDDDDMISEDYFFYLKRGINLNVDCCSLRGIITWDGINPEVFEHSVQYREWNTTNNQIKYERYPNHLNCIKSKIAKQIRFETINFGEDRDWSIKLRDSALIRVEYFIDKIIYNYQYVSRK